jgi:hypothetical protein
MAIGSGLSSSPCCLSGSQLPSFSGISATTSGQTPSTPTTNGHNECTTSASLQLTVSRSGNSRKSPNACRTAAAPRWDQIKNRVNQGLEVGRQVGFILAFKYPTLISTGDSLGLFASPTTCVLALFFGPGSFAGPRTRVLLERRSPSLKLWTIFVITSPPWGRSLRYLPAFYSI